jgi:hypothetical protein
MAATEAFVAMANAHPGIPRHDWGVEHYYIDTPGRKVTRIVQCTQEKDGTLRSKSVHCFIDNATGDVYKAAGWKAPAKGARGNIVTGLDDIADRFDWSGGYLYR